jgi:mRNA-degrading endonuclease toxin of MazEF toxin-antitoxin module
MAWNKMEKNVNRNVHRLQLRIVKAYSQPEVGGDQAGSSFQGLSTQVAVGINEGLKHDSAIHCDELVSLPKSMLTNYVGRLSFQKLRLLEKALKIALQIDSMH